MPALITCGRCNGRVNSRLGVFNVSSDELDMCPYDFATVRDRVPLCHYMSLLLPSGDEPMVVPDTHLDWRFAKNVRRIPILIQRIKPFLLTPLATGHWATIRSFLCGRPAAHAGGVQCWYPRYHGRCATNRVQSSAATYAQGVCCR
jgi:hypothetical protein